MCQLTFANTNNRLLNLITATVAVEYNSRTVNKDGVGFSYKGEIIRWPTFPMNVPDMGVHLKKLVKGTSGIMCHVRQATTGAKLSIDDTHPFESSNLILAHNGTLKRKIYLKDDEGKMDSRIFLDELEVTYQEDENLVLALDRAMKKFTGKFAFLIYDKKNKVYYAARGTTANLSMSAVSTPDGTNIGYVINTDQDDLLKIAAIVWDISGYLGTPIIFGEPKKLEDNSVYILAKDSIVHAGKVTENYVASTTYSTRWPSVSNGTGNNNKGNGTEIFDVYLEEAINFLTVYSLSIGDINIISNLVLKKGLFELCEEEIKILVRNILPQIRCDKKFRKSVKAVSKGQMIPKTIYNDGGFQFPYPLINKEKDKLEFIRAVEKYFNDSKTGS